MAEPENYDNGKIIDVPFQTIEKSEDSELMEDDDSPDFEFKEIPEQDYTPKGGMFERTPNSEFTKDSLEEIADAETGRKPGQFSVPSTRYSDEEEAMQDEESDEFDTGDAYEQMSERPETAESTVKKQKKDKKHSAEKSHSPETPDSLEESLEDDSLEDENVEGEETQEAPKFDKAAYNSLAKEVAVLSALKEDHDKYNAKKMDINEVAGHKSNMIKNINSILPKEARYSEDELAKYAKEKKEDELMKNLGADLEDYLYDPKLKVQKNYVSKFPTYVTNEFAEFVKNKDKIQGKAFYKWFYQPMAKALEKSSIQLGDDYVPSAIKKCISADHNGTEQSKKDIKEIVDEVVDSELDRVYSKETDKDAVELAKYFVKKSYNRRFKFNKDAMLGDYLKTHSDDLSAYLKNGAEAMANIEGSDEMDSGKKRLGAIKNYMDIYDKYANDVSAFASAAEDSGDEE